MTTFVQAFISMMESSLVASLVVKATFVMALALMVVFLPARRSRASLRHIFLAAAFAVLLALPFAAIYAPRVPILVSGPQQLQIMPEPSVITTDAPMATVAAGISAPVDSRSPEFSVSALLSAGWLLGTMLFLLPMAVGLKQLRSLRRTAIPWQHGQAAARQLAHGAGIHRNVEVLLHDKVSGPTTYGAVHPVILLPVDAENWDAEDLNRALVHELEHVRRGDWMSHCLARVVCSVYWFHPLVWMVWRQFGLDAERACDDAVLGRAEATAYADQLVGLARRLTALRKSPGLAMASRADLTARVGAVLDDRQRRGRAGALSVVLAWITAAILVAAVSPLVLVAAPQVVRSQAAIPVPVALPIAVPPPIVLAQVAAPKPGNAPYGATQPTYEATPAAPITRGHFSAISMMVITDITVRDQNGNAMEGLHADDFAITEDGKAQSIATFEFQKLPDTAGVQSAVSSYYVLGYYTTNDKIDGSYRRVSVSLKNNPAATINYRAGYYGSKVTELGSPDVGAPDNTTSSDITGPFVLSKVDPEYSEEARKAKYSGAVSLRINVDTSGQVTHATVTHSLGMGLDEKAIEAVMKWKLIPAKKDGTPVPAQSEVSVNFRLL